MLLQYLEALKRIGESPSTKYIIPAEFTQFVGPLATGLGVAIAASTRRPRRAEASHAPIRLWYHRTGVDPDSRPLFFVTSGGAVRRPG